MKFKLSQYLLPNTYHTQIRLFLLPYLIGSLILIALPALATAIIAFTEYSSLQTPVWNGLTNFRALMASPYVQISLRSSFLFLITAVPLRLLAALCLALLLQHKRRFFGLHRAAVYLPTVIPEVAYALIWLWLFNPLYGPLNLLLSWLGLPAPAWLVEPDTAVAAIVIMSLFQIGEGFIVLIASLQTIPRSYYEAAKVDGASSLQSFWHITLPLILPWLLMLTFRDLILSLQNTFTPSFVMTYGGPYYATTFVPLLIYELAFDFFDFGMAAALLVIMYLLILLLVIGILNLVGEVKLSDDL
ncbi:MAG: sugar ABC transporter permease [Ardenticatenaceae bacterium]|nr:sugar ABC transporter permease [Ardenticatenaceae bacterium]